MKTTGMVAVRQAKRVLRKINSEKMEATRVRSTVRFACAHQVKGRPILFLI